ncbi:MAG: DUF4157 domain-containing protein [Fibrobacter sp.]|nr:DUF4157 domain-containing protein [Fibrobacter sp.]
MLSIYSKKQNVSQKKDASSAFSVLDASSQNEGLQRKAEMTNNAAHRAEVPRPNNTGMPDNLKFGIESLSGFSMDDVRVHYNSSRPATVQALAYTQGTDIHVAPGQEKHLPHEAWHVAQQMAGRVSPTTNINGMPVNVNAGLEHEADVMGEKAVQCKKIEYKNIIQKNLQCTCSVIQCGKEKKKKKNIADIPAAAAATPFDSGRLPADIPAAAAAAPSDSGRLPADIPAAAAAAATASFCRVYDLAEETSPYYDPDWSYLPTWRILKDIRCFQCINEDPGFFDAFRGRKIPDFIVELNNGLAINMKCVIASLFEKYISKKLTDFGTEDFTKAKNDAYTAICKHLKVSSFPLEDVEKMGEEEQETVLKSKNPRRKPSQTAIKYTRFIADRRENPGEISFTDVTDLKNQLVQDFLLCDSFDQLSPLIGHVHHTFSDFCLEKNSDVSDEEEIPLHTLKPCPTGPFTLYKTLRIEAIAKQQKNPINDRIVIYIFPLGTVGGHGGALGTALHYFKQARNEDCLLVKVSFDNMPTEEWNQFMIKFDNEGDDAKSETTSELPLEGSTGENTYNQFSFNFSPGKKLRTLYIKEQKAGRARCEVIYPSIQKNSRYKYQIFDFLGGQEIWESSSASSETTSSHPFPKNS